MTTRRLTPLAAAERNLFYDLVVRFPVKRLTPDGASVPLGRWRLNQQHRV
jgi:hypothetical protein